MEKDQNKINSSKDTTSLDMKKSMIIASYEAAAFMLLRYPYLCAVLLMVTTAEELATKTIDKSYIQMIYVNLGLLFAEATLMAFDLFNGKRFAAVFTSFHFIYISYQEYTKSYTEQIIFRLLTRNIAIMGCFLMVSGGLAKSKGTQDKNKFLLSCGRQLIGTYAFLSGMFIWNSPQEFQFYSKCLPGNYVSTILIITAFVICALSIYSGYEVVFFSKVLAGLIIFLTLFIDLNLRIWQKEAHLRHWIIYTIASRHLPVLSTLLLIRKGFF